MLNNEPITLEFLREHLHNNDFSTMPVKDPSKYNAKELKLYNRVLALVNAEWKSISKKMGLTHPQDCYSKDYPPELLRERIQRIIADNVVKIRYDKKAFWNVLKAFIIPMIFKRKSVDLALHNTTNALMQTLDIDGLSKSARDFSCDEDFNRNKALNYPKMDHDKRWNHSRSKIKVELLDEIAEKSLSREPPQIFDKTCVENSAEIHILIEQLIKKSTEQEQNILKLLSEGYNQSEIAQKLSVS